MEIDYVSHHLLFFCSLAAGLFSGAVYDAFRLIRAFFKGRVFLFITDVVFCVYYSCLMCVLFFNYSHGRIRAYALIASGIGFAAYHFTLGRVTGRVFAFIRSYLSRVFGVIKTKTLRKADIFRKKIYSYSACRRMISSAANGFEKIQRAKNKSQKAERSENRQCKGPTPIS